MTVKSKSTGLSDVQILLVLAGVRLLIHILANGQYGFHRDALAFLDNGRHLAWGYVAYPPLTPFIGRIGLELFGLSLVGIKSLAALALGGGGGGAGGGDCPDFAVDGYAVSIYQL